MHLNTSIKSSSIREEMHHSETSTIKTEAAAHDDENDVALYLFPFDSKFRKVIIKITSSRWFEYFIILLIVGASVFMAIENPLEPVDSPTNVIIFYCDLAVTVIFTIEVIMKVIAKGLIINGEESYLHTFWNCLDLLIVIVSIISLVSNFNSTLKVFKIIRMIRVLRPLRVIGRNDGLKLAVQTLIMAVPHILNVLLVSLILYMIFGIFCVNFLKGKFYYCYTD